MKEQTQQAQSACSESSKPNSMTEREAQLRVMRLAKVRSAQAQARDFVDKMAGSLLSEDEKSALFRSSDQNHGQSTK